MALEPPAFQLPQLLAGLGFGILDGVLGAKLGVEVGRVRTGGHADGQGEAGVVSVWQPMGLSPRPHGVALSAAARLSWGNSEAWQAGEGQYRIRTPRGEGGFAIEGAPALTLEC